MPPAKYSFGQSVGVLWEEVLCVGVLWEKILSQYSAVYSQLYSPLGRNLVLIRILQCRIYSPPCIASVKGGNTSRRREMNLAVSSMFVVPNMNAITTFVVYFSVCIAEHGGVQTANEE